MAYYGSGYSSGINQNFNPITSSPQAGAIPTAGGYYNAQSALPGPTVDSKGLQGANVADKIQTPALGSLLNGGQQGAINEQQRMSGLPDWANQFIQTNAGYQGNMGKNQSGMNNYSSGQLNDAYYSSAPTLGGIYSQYGSGFDPSKFTGLSSQDGSLMGLENGLSSHGYNLGNIGRYYQDQSQQNGAMKGVNYGFDPTFGITGSIGGLNFDVNRMQGLTPGTPFTNQNHDYGAAKDYQSWSRGPGASITNYLNSVSKYPVSGLNFDMVNNALLNNPNTRMGVYAGSGYDSIPEGISRMTDMTMPHYGRMM